MSGQQYAADVFISYSHADQAWVRGELLSRLESAGLKVHIDYRDFEIGVPSLVNIERAVDRSRYTLVVLTPAWVESEWTDFESLLTATADPAGRKRKVIPLMLAPCQPPARIAMLTYADFTDPATREAEMARLLRSAPQPASLLATGLWRKWHEHGMTPEEHDGESCSRFQQEDQPCSAISYTPLNSYVHLSINWVSRSRSHSGGISLI